MLLRTPKFWYHKQPVNPLLKGLSSVYQFFSQRRMSERPHYVSKIPVICVGNLTTGGAGKTPVCLALAKVLKQKYFSNIHFISRGYGRKKKGALRVHRGLNTADDVGDEALLLATEGEVWVGKDRVELAKQGEKAGADVILMDDGLQYPFLAKDLNIVVVDGTMGFGNGYSFPAGPLREPVLEGLGRSDLLIIVGEDRQQLKETYAPLLPTFETMIEIDGERYKGQKVFAFAGIGLPEKFIYLLERYDIKIVKSVFFPDHYSYTTEDLEGIIQEATQQEAIPLTTMKDYVKIDTNRFPEIKSLSYEILFKNRSLLEAYMDQWLVAQRADKRRK